MVRGPAAAAQKDPRWDLDRDPTWADSIQRYDKEKLVAPPVPQVLPGRMYRDGRTNQKTEERQYDVLAHKWRDDAMEGMKSQEQTAALVQHMDKAAVSFLCFALFPRLSLPAHFPTMSGHTHRHVRSSMRAIST